MKAWRVCLAVLVIVCLGAAASLASAYTGRISVAGGGTQTDGASGSPSVDRYGNVVAFASAATNLVEGDTNGCSDIFATLLSGGIFRVSVDSLGNQADGASTNPFMSPEGSSVVYESIATNLVAGDTNGVQDVFATDIYPGGVYGTYIISVGPEGQPADGPSREPSISAGNQYVAFTSDATNFVAGDTNGVSDVFVRDRNAGTTARASVNSAGEEATGPSYLPVISANGQFVVFISEATNLVEGDTNGVADVFIRDLEAGTTERVSVSTEGVQANGAALGRPSVSSDGMFVGFVSGASNLVAGDTNGAADVFVRDRGNVTTERVSVGADGAQANGASSAVSMGLDGRFVAFSSLTSNLVSDDTNGVADVFLRDRVTATTIRISVGSSSVPVAPSRSGGAAASKVALPPSGDQGDGPSTAPSVCMVSSNSAWFIAFTSDATNLVSSDTNGVADVFVRALGSAYVRDCNQPGSGQTCEYHGKVTYNGMQVAIPNYCDGTPFYFIQDVEYLVQFVPDPGYQFTEWVCCWSRVTRGGVVRDTLPDTVHWLPTDGAGDGNCYQITPRSEMILYTVTIDKTGDGTLTVNDVEVDLPYSATFYYNDPITITAAAGAGHVFSGWSGGASGVDNPLVIAVQSDLDIVAHFPLPTVSLDIDGIGSGSVKVNGTNQALPWSGAFPAGTTVALEAVPSAGQVFTGWSGGISRDDNPIELILLDDIGVTANFSTTDVTLDVTGDLDAGLKVNGVAKSFPYSGVFPWGTSVTLEAFPEDCARFDGWHGAATGMANPIVISMTMNKEISASFSSISAFTDIGCDYWAAREIAACADAGIVTGYPDGTYLPEASIDRAGMAVFIARALAGGDGSVPTAPATPTFLDVPADFWAYKYIEYAADKTIVVGYGDGTYKPTVIVDRGQMSVFISRSMVDPLGDAGLAPYTPPTSPTFSDVTSSNSWFWCYKYVEYLHAQGTVTGYPDGTYKPDVAVSRAQMAVYIARAFDLPL